MRHILGWDRGTGNVLNIAVEGIKYNCRFFENGISGHFRYRPEVVKILGDRKVPIFLYRDPRDIIVSWAKWVETERANRWFYYVDGRFGQSNEGIFRIRRTTAEKPEAINMNEVEDPIGRFIDWLPGTFLDFAGWLKEPDILKVTYEGLIEDPEKELAPVAKAIKEPLDKLVERSKFRGGWTYRKGIVGDWKNEFTEEHLKVFNRNYPAIMRLYGYDICNSM